MQHINLPARIKFARNRKNSSQSNRFNCGRISLKAPRGKRLIHHPLIHNNSSINQVKNKQQPTTRGRKSVKAFKQYVMNSKLVL